jgi:DNA-3-methyladenine glycosylase
LRVARDLLGKILVVRASGSRERYTAGRIVETEAYRKNDPACHAYVGPTPRNALLFGEPGRVYVYFIYGMYEMLNFVTEPIGHPGAVLIRAIEPLFGIEQMRARRPHIQSERDLANGPGRLARAMGVELEHKGEWAFGPNLFVLDDGFTPDSVLVSPRVGISQGSDLYWRYFVAENRYVSKAPQNKLGRTLRRGA